MWDVWKVSCLFSQIELKRPKSLFSEILKTSCMCKRLRLSVLNPFLLCVSFHWIEAIIQVGHPVRMKARELQGKREGHLGLCLGGITTGCSWQHKASWVLTAQSSGTTGACPNLLWNIPSEWPTVSNATHQAPSQGERGQRADPRRTGSDVDRGAGPNSNERQLWVRREWSLYSNQPRARDEDRISIYKGIQREWNSRRFMTYSNLQWLK